MSSMRERALALSSLSVYRGVMRRTVVSSLHRLLQSSLEDDAFAFVSAWSDYFMALAKKGMTSNVGACIGQAALYDENVLSRSAVRGKLDDLPSEVVRAATRDLDVLMDAAATSPEDLLDDFCSHGILESAVANSLPRWKFGQLPPTLSQTGDGRLQSVIDFHRRHGCGIYARYRAFVWRQCKLEPIPYPDPVKLSDLKGYETPRQMVLDNTLAFLDNLPANNILLHGDRGTGKSSTVKAILNQLYPQGLRMIECPRESLGDFPRLTQLIAPVPLKFIIFIDDLSFNENDSTYAALKAVLEGGLAARPANTLIYATSNRRHLIRETFQSREGDELHLADTLQETLSLSDRFGLSITFSSPDKRQYLDIVHALAADRDLDVDPAELDLHAERWALERGGRSPRVARQFIAMAESRLKRGLPLD